METKRMRNVLELIHIEIRKKKEGKKNWVEDERRG